MTLPIGSLQTSFYCRFPDQSELQPTLPSLLPQAKKIRVHHLAHGDIRTDDYDWMRHKSDPDFIKFLEEWNSYSNHYLEKLKPLSNQLYQEMASRIESDYETIPYKEGPYFYYKKFISGQDFPLYLRKPAEGGTPELLFDSNTLKKDHDYFDVKEFTPSPDGRYMVTTIDTDGSHFGSSYLLDCRTKQPIPSESISNTNANFVWNADSTGFWYVKLSQVKRFSRVYFHRIGTPSENDRLVYHETDGHFDLFISKDKLDRHLLIASVSKNSSYCMRTPLTGDGSLETFLPKKDNLLYAVYPAGEDTFVLANRPNKNHSLFVLEQSTLTAMHLSDKDTHIDRIEVFKDYVVMKKRHEGLLRFDVMERSTKALHTIPLPHDICDIDFFHNTSYQSEKVLVTLSSPISPSTIYEWDMKERRLAVRWQDKAAGFCHSNYEGKRIFAHNGQTAIPISLFHKKGLPRDGSRPLRLYVYGAYGSTNDPAFSPITAAFLERDCYFAIAHVRGGGDLGQGWYEDGRMEKKMNSFTDFIACAETLIREGYTSPEKLAIEGGSAGGLIIGAVMNMRPDLFKVCLLDVPFVDVVTTMSDSQVPLTEQEWMEWGNPIHQKDYEWMKLYSPFDNIRSKEYPACMVTGGFNDAQVLIREPAKWVAKMSEFKIGHQPLLFRTNMHAGHNGKAGRYECFEDCAPSYAFLLSQLGITL
jgi:oligopeptidase B